MKWLLCICLLLICNLLYSQSIYSGKVLDGKEKTPIPFAYILTESDDVIAITDSQGEFEFESNINEFTFYCMGYDSLCVELKTEMNKILLTPMPYRIEEVVITSAKMKAYREKINKKKIWPWNHILKIYAEAGNIKARLIPGNGRMGKLSKVFVYIVDDAEPNAKFRIKVYSNNNGKLGTDITPDNIIQKGLPNKWIEINVEEYHIPFPEKGLFVGIEILEGYDNKPYKKRFGHKGHNIKSFYGPVIGGLTKSQQWDEEVCYEYSIKDNYWHVQRPLWYIPMIAAEVIYNTKSR